MSDIKLPETKIPQHLGTGRRKTAIARVRLATGTGKIVINGRTFENFFPLETQRVTATQPLTVTGMADKFDAHITVTGGGPNGQAGAVPTILKALIAKDDSAALLATAKAYEQTGDSARALANYRRVYFFAPASVEVGEATAALPALAAACVIALLARGRGAVPEDAASVPVSAERIREHVEFLAADEDAHPGADGAGGGGSGIGPTEAEQVG